MRPAPFLFLVVALLFTVSAAKANDWDDCNKRGSPEELITACTKVIEGGQESIDKLVQARKFRAFLYEVQQNWDNAIADYTALIALNPKDAEIYLKRAGLLDIKKENGEALADLNSAIEINPRYTEAYQHRATLLIIRFKDYNGAIRDLTKALEIEPKKKEILDVRGYQFQRTGQFEKAIDDYDRSIDIKADDSYIFQRRGESWAKLGVYDKALSDLRKSIALDAKNTDAVSALAEVEKLAAAALASQASNTQSSAQPSSTGVNDQSKDLATCVGRDPGIFERPGAEADQMFEACTRYIWANPPNAVAYAHRGFLRLKPPGDFDGARKDLDEAIKADPTFAQAYILRSFASGAASSNDNAKKYYSIAMSDLEKAISLNKKIGPAYHLRAHINFLVGKYKEALADAQIAQSADYSMVGKDIVEVQRELPDMIAAIERAMKAAEAKSSSVTETAPSTPDAGAVPKVDLGTRVALVIGNGAYRTVPGLPNPGTDADLAAQALRTAGFGDVTVAKDLDRAGLVAALQDFQVKADKADWAVVYYAGHGIEVAGRNFLIPVDARLKDDRNMEDEAVPLDRVLTSIGGAAKIRLVVLDACRDNPFAVQMRASGKTRSVGRGLARVEPEGSTVVLFAAREGTTAIDGDGAHSPFAEAFARRITEKGVELGLAIRRLSADVVKATDKTQEPVQYGRLPEEELYFIPPG